MQSKIEDSPSVSAMATNLSDIANWAQILSVPVALLAWLITADRFTKFWKRWRKLIFGTVVCLGLWGLARLGFLNWLQKSIQVPVWLACLLLLLTFLLLFLARTIARRIAAAAAPPPTSDNIDGIEWQWDYRGKHIDEHSLTAFCPNQTCRCRLEPQRLSGFAAINDIALVCQHCGFTREFDCSLPQLIRKTVLEIERRFRVGRYEQFR